MSYIGISFGTSNVCCSKSESLQNSPILSQIGNKYIPCAISFYDDEILVGEPALGSLSYNEENTVPNIIKLIGIKYDDPTLQDEMKNFAFTVSEKDGMPIIELEEGMTYKMITPVKLLEIFINKAIQKEMVDFEKPCLISVPIGTSPEFISDIKEAFINTGLKVLGTIEDPIAAIYGSNIFLTAKKENVIVFDIGSDVCDVTAVIVEEKGVVVKKQISTKEVCGRLFDEKIFNKFRNYLIKEFNIDPNRYSYIKKRVELEAESVKNALSKSLKVTGQAEFIINRGICVNLYVTVTKEEFEDMCNELFVKCGEIVKELVKEAGWSVKDVDNILCIGGCSNIPKIVEKVTKVLPYSKLVEVEDPINVIASGAAIKAEIDNNIDLILERTYDSKKQVKYSVISLPKCYDEEEEEEEDYD